jgi:hypothetical protein
MKEALLRFVIIAMQLGAPIPTATLSVKLLKEARRFRLLLVALLLVAVSSGCVGIPSAAPAQSFLVTPNSLQILDKQWAIDAGKTGCNVFRSHQDEEPYAIEAQLLPLFEADRLFSGPNGKGSYNMPDDTVVWVVQMRGKWHTEGGPEPTGSPGEPFSYFNHCIVMFNATTGISLGYRLDRIEK